MSDDREDVDARLARLAAATTSIGPRAGFEARVLQAIAADAGAPASGGGSEFVRNVTWTGRYALVIGGMAAAAAIAFAVVSQQTLDSEAAVAYASVEIGW